MLARRTLSQFLLAALPLTALAAAACGDSGDGSNETNADESLIACGSVVTPDPARSLFVTDATALAGFSFKSVMDQIAASGSTTHQSSLSVYQQMMDTMNDKAHAVTKGPHCDDNGGTIDGFGIECPRAEGALARTNPFGTDGNSYVPIGLVNRFDLAPKNGANCGQYRVVFGKISGKTNFADRVLLIFEAVLPNPTPAKGLAACTPVAAFWDSLSSDANAASRAAKLKSFYFKGLPGFSPVIAAAHYGIGGGTNTGQIRANMFFNDNGPVEWQLREFHLGQTCVAGPDGGSLCTLTAHDVAVQNNPFGALFDCGSGGGGGGGGGSGDAGGGGGGGGSDGGIITPGFAEEALAFASDGGGGVSDAGFPPPFDAGFPPPSDGGSSDAGFPPPLDGGSFDAGGGDGGGGGTCTDKHALAFQAQFLKQVGALSSTNLNGIAMATRPVDNAGESNEQDSTNDYLAQGGSNAALLAQIAAALPKGSALTAENILDRATTQSCAGCHEVSVGRNLGGGLVWPASNGFTQIDESSRLSPALTGTFLPFRARVLKSFLQTQCSTPDSGAVPASGAAATSESQTTVGGGAVGAPN